MAEYDDIWTKDQVICTYGERSFEDALANRKKEIEIMKDTFERILKR